MNPVIVHYYRLCSARLGDRSHIVDSIRRDLDDIFTPADMEQYFALVDGHLVAKETIIGGKDTSDPIPNISKNNKKCIIFG